VNVTLLLPEGHGPVCSSHPYDLDGRVMRLKLTPAAKSVVDWNIRF
jgi:hypothetical protein